MNLQQRLLARSREARSRREATVLERAAAARQRLFRIDARGQEIMKAGFLGAWAIARGDEVMIGTRAPCGASLRIPLDGPLPRCGEDCPCNAESKRRVKERSR